MFFAKLFGTRREADDEPEAKSTPPRVRQAPPAEQVVSPPVPAAGAVSAFPTQGKQATTGFDPYNSGAFKKSNAWERVTRR